MTETEKETENKSLKKDWGSERVAGRVKYSEEKDAEIEE